MDFLLTALALLVLTGLVMALLWREGWPAGRDVLALRIVLGLAGALVLVGVVLTMYAYDRNVLSALIYGVPQAPAKP